MSSVVSKANVLAEKASNVAMYGGAGLATVSISEWCQIIGVILAAAGFAYNIYHKEKVLKELRSKSTITIKED